MDALNFIYVCAPMHQASASCPTSSEINLHLDDISWCSRNPPIATLQLCIECAYHGCSGSLDFANPAALRQLTRALLAEDFGVADWHIPDGQLIPPVPNRLNYIHWVEDLLRASCPPGAPIRAWSSTASASGRLSAQTRCRLGLQRSCDALRLQPSAVCVPLADA